MTEQLHIGVSNNDQGVHVNIMQKHPDGTHILLYAAKAPEGDSYGRFPVTAPANKLASFPLEHYADSPDDEVLVGFQNWQLTVGDVRAAKAASIPGTLPLHKEGNAA